MEAIEQLKAEQMVNIYRIAKSLRIQKPSALLTVVSRTQLLGGGEGGGGVETGEGVHAVHNSGYTCCNLLYI